VYSLSRARADPRALMTTGALAFGLAAAVVFSTLSPAQLELPNSAPWQSLVVSAAAAAVGATHPSATHSTTRNPNSTDPTTAKTRHPDPMAPPVRATATQNHAWWRSLTPAQQAQIVAAHPEQVGNLDGVPMSVRNRIDRARVAAELAALQAAEPSAAVMPDDMAAGAIAVPNPAYGVWQDKMSALVNTRLALQTHPDMALVMLAVGAERVDIALAVGDVDTADNVGVYAQGLFSNTSDAVDVRDVSQQMYDLERQADQLITLSKRRDLTTALVMWMGYDAPQNLIDAMSEKQAEDGAVSLASFADGIKAVNPSARVVGVGHSYGSTTLGLAARRTSAFSAIVAFGSPGLGTDRVSDLRVPAGDVYALANPVDPVAGLGRFGTVPTEMPGVMRLSTAAHLDLKGPAATPVSLKSVASGILGSVIAFVANLPTGFRQHNQYLVHDSTAEYNIAAVLADLPDRLIR